jgi:hypothetical protein
MVTKAEDGAWTVLLRPRKQKAVALIASRLLSE